MKTEVLTASEALSRGKALPFALVRALSAVSLGPTPAALPPEEELLEVRFFSETEEIRLFRRGDALAAVRLTETADEEYFDTEFDLENREFGARVRLRQTLCYDADGQAYPDSGRLWSWEGGSGDGKE